MLCVTLSSRFNTILYTLINSIGNKILYTVFVDFCMLFLCIVVVVVVVVVVIVVLFLIRVLFICPYLKSGPP